MSISNEAVMNLNEEAILDKTRSCKILVQVTEEAQGHQMPRYAAYQQSEQTEKLRSLLPKCKSASIIEEGSSIIFTRILIRSLLTRLGKLNNALASGVINLRLLMVHRILERFRNDLLESKIVVNTKECSNFTVRAKQKNPLNKRNVRLCTMLTRFKARIQRECSQSVQILKKWENYTAQTSECIPVSSRIDNEFKYRTDSHNALIKCVQIQQDLLSAVISLDTRNAECQILSYRRITSCLLN